MEIHLYTTILVFSLSLYLLNIYFNVVYLTEYILHFFEKTLDEEYFDYIIVGCGTAGSLIAHHLSAVNNLTFLVLEAGGTSGPLLNVPTFGPSLQKSIFDWQYKTTLQNKACHGFKNSICSWPMGKIIGGSARLNNMIHVRGYLDEVSEWFGRKYNVSELENYLTDLEYNDLFHNKLAFKTSLSHAFMDAGMELGFKRIDSSVVAKVGFMEPLVNQVKGSRWSTSHTLLNFFHHTNGKIISNAFVHKVLFKKDASIVAKSVEFERFGKKLTVHARKGVILTAGAIGTPKILMLSGIGPKEHLNDVNIPLVKDLPVGENLMDHVTTGLDLVVLDRSINYNVKDFLNPINALNYYIYGKGLWTSPGCEALAFINTNQCVNDTKCNYKPNLQLMVLPVGISSDHGVHLKNVIGVNDHVWENYFSKFVHNNSISILPVVLHPKSKGTVRLSSSNAYDSPLINPNYYSHSDDLDIIYNGIRFIKLILKTQSMKDLGVKLNEVPFPGCDNFIFDTKEYWQCYAKHLTLTSYHPVGTSKMGPSDDVSSVINYDFSVKGINNLYVADASIFPTMVSGNPNTAVALVAKIFSKLLVSQYM